MAWITSNKRSTWRVQHGKARDPLKGMGISCRKLANAFYEMNLQTRRLTNELAQAFHTLSEADRMALDDSADAGARAGTNFRERMKTDDTLRQS